jgi:uncharacterized protein YprB with RNaseH-like and TPR domain
LLNLKALSKTELNQRLKFKCVHRHNGLAHPTCFDQANGRTERVAYLDIESSALNASFGIVLCYCLKGEDGKWFKRSITPEEIRSGVFDKPLLKQFCKDVRHFDRVIGYYSSKFDIPFLRTRCIHHHLDFPIFKELLHTDMYFVAKRNTLPYSRRLGVLAPFFGIPSKGHPLNGDVWLKCLSGNQKAIDFVLTHCEEDIISTQKLWKKLNPYTRLTRSSI